MGKVRKGRKLAIAFLMIFLSFFTIVGKVGAYYRATGSSFIWLDINWSKYKGDMDNSDSFWCGQSPKIHLFLGDEETEFGENGWGTPRAGKSRNSTGGKECKPLEVMLPEANPNADAWQFYGYTSHLQKDGMGILEWYDNPNIE